MYKHGYDDAICAVSEDFLSRERTANKVVQIIQNTKPDWSARIGVYGKWGEGKTSVLRMVDEKLINNEVITLWLNPWSMNNIESVWAELVRQLLDKLKIKVKYSQLLRYKILNFFRRKKDLLVTVTDIQKELDSLSVDTTSIISGVYKLIDDLFPSDGDNVNFLIKKLKINKVVVFIDDLDRANPSLVPKLLMGLRELLDKPNLFFVLAFDNKLVTSCLNDYSRALVGEHDFLDKIIDFPIYLPKISNKDKLGFIRGQIEANANFADIDELVGIIEELPDNPRKIKLFIRKLALLKTEITRHYDWELDWVSIYFSELIRIESQEFFDRIASRFLDDSGPDWFTLLASEGDKEEKNRKRVNILLDECGIKNLAQRDLLGKLVSRWQSMSGFDLIKIKYQINIDITPHNITWKEFDSFFNQWEIKQDTDLIDKWISGHSQRREVSTSIIVDELFESSIDYRSRILSQAAEKTTSKDHADILKKADCALVLIEKLMMNDIGGISAGRFLKSDYIKRLLDQVEYWAHFATNKADIRTREKEKRFLTKILKQQLEDLVDIFEMVAPYSERSSINPGNMLAMRKELSSIIEERVCDAALCCFDKSDSIDHMRAKESRRSMIYIFFHPDSKMFSSGRLEMLYKVFKKAKQSSVVHNNCISYAKLLIECAQYGSGIGSDGELKLLFCCRTYTTNLWNAIICREFQFRNASDILSIRDSMIQYGADANSLSIPVWLSEYEKILNTSA